MTLERPMFPPGRESVFRVVAGTDFNPAAPQTKLPEKKNRPEDSPLAFKGDADAAYLRTLHSEIYWTLPFVTMPAEKCEHGASFGNAPSCGMTNRPMISTRIFGAAGDMPFWRSRPSRKTKLAGANSRSRSRE
jgi:hypothetical protein